MSDTTRESGPGEKAQDAGSAPDDSRARSPDGEAEAEADNDAEAESDDADDDDADDARSRRPSGRRERRRSVFGPGGWARRLARLWGFLGFAILVVILARHVILPFVFALLIAYVLDPVVDRMSVRQDGTKRMPRGLAILMCYVVLLAFLASFVVVLMPRLSKDAARIGREAPQLYDKLNDEWAPELAGWLEERFPSMAAPEAPEAPEAEAESRPRTPENVGMSEWLESAPEALPPGTAFVVTELSDGRLAVQIPPSGIDLNARADGGFTVVSREENGEHHGVEDKLRAWANKVLTGLQSQVGDFFRFGQAVIIGLIRSVFSFFLVLMVAAFILIDSKKLSAFVRGLFPDSFRADYDVITAGMNRGLSGVIRGQLLICLVNGILTYIGLLILSVKYSLILAVIAAIMSLIPIFGSILSTLPIVLAALVSGDEGIDVLRGVGAVAWIVGIHFLEANFLNPKIIGTAAKIHPVLVIFALIAGEHSYGLVGALLAVPVASMIQVLFVFFRRKAWRTEGGPPSGGQRAVRTVSLPGPDDDGNQALESRASGSR